MIPFLALAVQPAFAVACPSSTADIQQLDGAAEAAFSALDATALNAAVEELDTAIACLRSPISPSLAAETHRAFAFAAFAAGDRAGAGETLTAALAIDPGYRLPETLLPPQHPLRTMYAEPVKPSGPGSPLVGNWLVDGARGDTAPRERPSFLQHLGDNGEVLTTTHSQSARGVNGELTVIEAELSKSEGQPGLVPGVLDRLAAIAHAQTDCETQTRTLYDTGLVFLRAGYLDAARGALQSAVDGGKGCTGEYGSRALSLLQGPQLRSTRSQRTDRKRDFRLGMALGLNLGGNARVRDTEIGLDSTGAPISMSTRAYPGLGPALTATLDLRRVLAPAVDVGASAAVSSVLAENNREVLCGSALCDADASPLRVGLMAEGTAFLTLVPGAPGWHVKPLVRLGAVARFVPGVPAEPGTTVALNAMSTSGSSTVVDWPAFPARVLGGGLVAIGIRVPLSGPWSLDVEQAVTWFPNPERDTTSSGLGVSDASNPVGVDTCASLRLSTAF